MHKQLYVGSLVGMWHAGICLVPNVSISSATNCTLGTVNKARGYLATFCVL